MAQIRQVVSEQLQATIRRLLPSQQGFTEDLQASNVITPIIDLTPSAEGSALDTDLARSLAFGSQTAFDFNGSTGVVINNTGFYRIVGTSTINNQTTARANTITMSDGLSTKTVWKHGNTGGGSNDRTTVDIDLVVFLSSGDSVSMTAGAECTIAGSTRQVADINGNVVNPDGFVVS